MLDVKYIREHADDVRDSIKKRGLSLNLDDVLRLDQRRLALSREAETLRHAQRAELNKTKAKELKAQFKKIETELNDVENELEPLLLGLPNAIDRGVPEGDEANNKELRAWGEKTTFPFKPLDHLNILEKLGLVDFERGAKVAGSRFYFLKGKLAELSLAIIRYALDHTAGAGYEFMLSPQVVTKEILLGKGFLTPEEIALNAYKLDDEDRYLIGTGEIPLTGFHAGEMLSANELPRKYTTLTPCYRREAGTYGKHTKGLFRVHQFDKLEMYQLVAPDDSDKALEDMVALEENVLQGLGIPYRVVLVASAEMGGYLAKLYDLEYWSPVDSVYREIMSAGNAREFQARRLSIRFRGESGKPVFVHTLNATVAAVPRLLIAIAENFQNAAGTVTLPEPLARIAGFKTLGGSR